MSALTLNKVSLNREKEQLQTYLRFLPSLELKREQLLAERAMAARRMEQSRRVLAGMIQSVYEELPMLANERIDLGGLASVRRLDLGREKLLGLDMPVVVALEVAIRDYAYLAKPHWVDEVAERLKTAIETAIGLDVGMQRLALLEQALKKISQRINLFEQVLMPQARQNVKTIAIALSDAEKSAVVRAKIAKRIHRRTAS